MTDCLQEVVVIGGLAVGCLQRGHGLGVLIWSYVALIVILYRDFDWLLLARVLGRDYTELLSQPTASRTDERKARLLAAARGDRRGAWGPFGRLLDRLAPKGTLEQNPFVFWTKRALLLRNGERYLLISLLAAAGRPEWVFPVIGLWGGAVYPLTTARRWQLFGKR